MLKRLLAPDEQKDWGYALQLVDNADEQSSLKQSRDCLVRRKRGALGLGKCSSLDTAWSWRVSGEGILFHGGRRLHPSQCLWRTNVTLPILSSCEADEEDSSSRLVRFSLVRYHTSSKTATLAVEEDIREQTRIKEEMKQQRDEEKEQEAERHPVTSVDLAHSHALEPLMHPDLKPSSRLLFAPVGGASSSLKQSPMLPHNLLKAASPVLLALDKKNSPQPPPIERSAPVKLRKMPTHPYIVAANDNVWKDPQTGLEFRTDLCEYLGHDRKESGRHTITGVGQYTRTVFNVKVCVVCLSNIDCLRAEIRMLSRMPLLLLGLWRGVICIQARRFG